MIASSIIAGDGQEYQVRILTRDLARSESECLLRIHNIIPYVHWEVDDLLADVSPKGVHYDHKWDLSLAVFDENKAVGLLIAYMRGASSTHPVESIYVHRLAIAPDYQSSGIGSRLLRTALEYYSQEFPRILTYTVQTNDEESNEKVIRFYETVGFERYLPVRYPEKLDILLKLEKADLSVPSLRS